MTPEETAQWMDEWTEAGATSGKFTSIAALIRAQAKVVAAARDEHAQSCEEDECFLCDALAELDKEMGK